MSEIGQDIELAARYLREGKLVAIPTETVYGLAAIATNPQAVVLVFETKKRPRFDPLIVHVHSIEVIKKYASLENEQLKKLAFSFWPGPLTLLLPKKSSIPDLVTAGLERVAIRIPNHPLSLQLLKTIDAPLAAPSANPFGYVSPTLAEHVKKQLGDQVDYILDGGPCNIGLESTIVGLEEEEVCIYRLGGLSVEDIKACCGNVKLKLNTSSNPKAPGQLKSHYSPLKPFFYGDLSQLLKDKSAQKRFVIGFGKNDIIYNSTDEFLNLSESANLREAAMNLFAFLRLADESACEIILCQKIPTSGLGAAINDRLQRAASRD